MNYLVHLYLSGEDPELQLGGLMGDFVKGPIPACFSEKLALGLQLHRRIDSLAQLSPHTRQSRRRLHPRYGHGRGIIIDIFYDHFLAAHWSDYSPVGLEDYAAQIYGLLQNNHQRLPVGLQQIAPRMIEYDWLASYRHREVVGKALHRIAQRLSRPLPLGDSIHDLAAHEPLLRRDFSNFMREAAAYVNDHFDIKINPEG